VDDRTDQGDNMTEPEGTRADLRWGTIPGLLRDVAARASGREALVDLSDDAAVRLTFADLRDRADEVARGLMARGVEPGDRVAIWAPNIWEWVAAVLGLQSAGAVVVPLNTRYKGIEAADILRRSRARVLFTVEGFLGNDYVSMLRDAVADGIGPGAPAGGLPDLTGVVLLRGDGGGGGGGALGAAPVEALADLVAAGSDVDPADLDARVEALRPDDVADMLYTSGTTGAPKGVVQPHASTLRAMGDWADLVGLEPTDRYLVINPFFHSFGYKAGIVAGLITACTLVPIPTFDVQRAMEVITAERISMIPGPPTIYHTLLNDPTFDPTEVDTLRLAVTGAAAVPVSLVEDMRNVLGFQNVITAYGLTEASGVVTACRPDDDAETISHTSGRAIPGVEVRIVDDDGAEVPRGEPGELVVRGYNVMREYFEDPEQTAEAIDTEGWLHTGDIATMDARGYIDITDRKKDMFIVGGFNAYPAEIESLLRNHPEVSEAAVVGVPDERMGEVGHAYVVPVSGTHPDPDAIRDWARQNMANYKVPRTVEVVASLPTNAAGKVLRYELRDRAAAAAGGSGG
jgi:acyl-CoA synthetase (AMP-forming)/AMP-acid ligase II